MKLQGVSRATCWHTAVVQPSQVAHAMSWSACQHMWSFEPHPHLVTVQPADHPAHQPHCCSVDVATRQIRRIPTVVCVQHTHNMTELAGPALAAAIPVQMLRLLQQHKGHLEGQQTEQQDVEGAQLGCIPGEGSCKTLQMLLQKRTVATWQPENFGSSCAHARVQLRVLKLEYQWPGSLSGSCYRLVCS